MTPPPSNMASDAYRLRRDQAASCRLNYQHLLWTDVFGWILHPDITDALEHEKEVEIVDVGTGTGVVPLQLSKELAWKPKSLVGLDISNTQFPYSSWWPDNVQLSIADAFNPEHPSKEYQGRFNVVHVRYFLSLIKTNPNQFIDFVLRLLKPGGYLQWGEPLISSLKVVTNGQEAPGITKLMSLLRDSFPSPWLDKLSETLEQRGFEVINVERAELTPWHRGWHLDNLCLLANEVVGAKADAMSEMVTLEHRDGAWLDFRCLCVVARLKHAS